MNPSLLWIAAALFTWGIGEGMFFIFQPLYLQQLGASPVEIGGILGAAGMAMGVAHIPAGYLADRIGRRPLLIAAWSVGLVATWIMAFAPGLSVFIIGMLLYGFTAFVSAPLNSYVTAARGNWSIGRAMTLITATFNLGMTLGPITGGWIGEHYGLRTAYSVAGCIFVVSTILLFFIKPQPRDHHDPESPPLSLFGNQRFMTFLAVLMFAWFAMYLPQPFTANFLQNQRGLTLASIGLLGSIGNLGSAALSFLLGHLEARVGFLLGQLGVIFFATIIWLTTGLPLYALGYFLLGGFRAARSLGAAQVQPLVHGSQMGLAYGITETVAALTIITAPILAGFIYGNNPAFIYPLSMVLIALTIFIAWRFAPRSASPAPAPVMEEIHIP